MANSSVPVLPLAHHHLIGGHERGLGGTTLPPGWLDAIAGVADGDARRALILLETAVELARAAGGADDAALQKLVGRSLRRFDKAGDAFYDQISALHKSVRGSDPDAALYWYARMLDGGADPRYLARRVTRMSLEEIGHYFGGRDHSTVLYAIDKIARLAKEDEELRSLVTALLLELQGPDGA